MDFQNVNPLNILLNAVSGNLLPMTTDNSSFSIVWKMYSALVWLLEITQMCVLIPGCFILPKEKTLKDGLIGIAVTMEVVYTVMRIHTRKALVQRLIQKLNNIMRVKDELMRSTVMETLKPIEIPLTFYWMAGLVSIIMWTTAPFTLVFQKNSFVYMDYKMPVVFSKEPFSTSIFVFGSLVVMLSSMYIFTKKVSVDSYIINMILLITAQYKYIALKLSMIFQDVRLQSNCNSSNEKKDYPETNFCAKEKIKFICQHYNAVFHVTLMLRELLAVSISIIYLNSVFRFCCIAIMVISIPSSDSIERAVFIMYASGGVVQLYILCSCVQQLLDASNEITDQAFHEPWYRFEGSIKRTFMFLIMANNLELKLSMFKRYNISLASFMTILNQSYSIALILLRTN
ncbi:odorant receptor 67a-like [Camponotus floridanus]|uniref:odorant receptor 67a-like n=1 Tax=Camponotus floridanus TaxID=104421 RepID=UPI000DC68BAF|nr:odorant receptor 67a-like [Camponotus floridanus]